LEKSKYMHFSLTTSSIVIVLSSSASSATSSKIKEQAGKILFGKALRIFIIGSERANGFAAMDLFAKKIYIF